MRRFLDLLIKFAVTFALGTIGFFVCFVVTGAFTLLGCTAISCVTHYHIYADTVGNLTIVFSAIVFVVVYGTMLLRTNKRRG